MKKNKKIIEPRDLVTALRLHFSLNELAKESGLCKRGISNIQEKNKCTFDSYNSLINVYDRLQNNKTL